MAEKFDPMIYFRLMFSTFTMTQDGDLHDLGFAAIQRGEIWRLLTPILLHFGPYHILFNMLALLTFGQQIEMVKGRIKYLVMIVAAGLAGNLGQYYVSGGLFGGMSGVLYAMAAYLWIKGQVAPQEGLGLNDRTARWFYIWFLLGIIAPIAYPQGQGMIFRMGNMAHGVGLLTGLVLGLLRF